MSRPEQRLDQTVQTGWVVQEMRDAPSPDEEFRVRAVPGHLERPPLRPPRQAHAEMNVYQTASATPRKLCLICAGTPLPARHRGTARSLNAKCGEWPRKTGWTLVRGKGDHSSSACRINNGHAFERHSRSRRLDARRRNRDSYAVGQGMTAHRSGGCEHNAARAAHRSLRCGRGVMPVRMGRRLNLLRRTGQFTRERHGRNARHHKNHVQCDQTDETSHALANIRS